jgi:hypothetical protein
LFSLIGLPQAKAAAWLARRRGGDRRRDSAGGEPGPKRVGPAGQDDRRARAERSPASLPAVFPSNSLSASRPCVLELFSFNTKPPPEIRRSGKGAGGRLGR